MVRMENIGSPRSALNIRTDNSPKDLKYAVRFSVRIE